MNGHAQSFVRLMQGFTKVADERSVSVSVSTVQRFMVEVYPCSSMRMDKR
jgi:hypothetical protein